MNRPLCLAAFVLGLAVVAWVGHGYLGSNPLALTMTLLIAAFYAMGALELWRFDGATRSLNAALADIPADLARLGDWLDRVPTSLQNPVRLRIEGERVALPGPAMTPYLLGLLVLLGMLGTFLGMVVTLNGAVLALESTTDLAAMRAALAAPVQGLGLAFGTSVAGVAASSMLGLVSALCRRERLQAAQRLDTRTATTLRAFSLAHQRQAMLETLQSQARALPELLGHMQALMAQMERRSAGLGERLLEGQARFHDHARVAYADLASSVGRSLELSLTRSAEAAGATIQPVVQAAMAGIAREAASLQAGTAAAVQQSLQAWTDKLDHQAAFLLDTVDRAHAARQAEAASAEQQRLQAWTNSLEGMAGLLQRDWQQAGAKALEQQAQICRTLERSAGEIHEHARAQARDILAEMAQLVDAAAQAPRAAAELVGQLRQQLSDSLARDNTMLEERSRLMATLGGLLDVVNRASTEQRAAIDGLVASAAALLQRAGAQFGERIEAESTRMAAAATQLAAGGVEMASLGEAFGLAVQLFASSSEALGEQLQRIESALGKSTARSDEQLAYYVAQARELIDLSLSSQQQIVRDLQRLAVRREPLAGELA